MEININNYEAYMIDFLEGKLDASLCDELRAFLALHPELAEELELVKEMPPYCHADETCPCKAELTLNRAGLPGLGEKTLDLWLAASFEGDLDAELERELDEFLLLNPGQQRARELMRLTRMSPGNETLADKASLKRTSIKVEVNQANYLQWLVAEMEGQTNETERRAIAQFIAANPALSKERDLLAGTRLVPDLAIRFEGKQALRRFVIPAITQRSAMRIAGLAASFLLVFGLYQNSLIFRSDEMPGMNISAYEWNSPAVPAPGASIQNVSALQTASVLPAIVRDDRPVPGNVTLRGAELAALPGEHTEPTELTLRHEKKPRVIYAGGDAEQPSSLTLQQYGAVKLRQYAYGSEEPVSSEGKVNKWELADAGIKGINKLTRGDLRFDRQFTPEGKLKSYRLGTERVYLAKQ